MKPLVQNPRRVRAGILLLSLASLLVVLGVQLQNPTRLLGASSSASQNSLSPKPTRIQIASVGVDLAIKEGFYSTTSKQWLIDEQSAFWANITPKPSEQSGNPLIYAHNQEGLFAATYQLKPGDVATVTSEGGIQLRYKYTHDTLVEPTNTTIFTDQGTRKLTLLCCYGPNNELRRLMNFEPL